MKFVEVVKTLQEQNTKKIILVKNGIFFVAIGKDALILSDQIGLKRTCMKEKLCKVGFLVKSSEKYIKILQEKNLSFGLYVIDKKDEKIEEIYTYEGNNIEEKRTCLNCEECMQKKDTDEDIIERLRNFGK